MENKFQKSCDDLLIKEGRCHSHEGIIKAYEYAVKNDVSRIVDGCGTRKLTFAEPLMLHKKIGCPIILHYAEMRISASCCLHGLNVM